MPTKKETSEISFHQWKVFDYVRRSGCWLMNKEISDATSVNHRTVRQHVKIFVDAGIFEVANVFPGHRYRYSKSAPEKTSKFIQRLDEAATVFKELESSGGSPL